jgi:accessory gene regulator protein AgrB
LDISDSFSAKMTCTVDTASATSIDPVVTSELSKKKKSKSIMKKMVLPIFLA